MNNLYLIVGIVAIVLFLAIVSALLKRRTRKQLNVEYFGQRWKDLQKLCGDKATWPLAIIDADKLLDEALRKSRFKGKTMGERLVTAQHDIKDNDSVWFAHKLRNKLVHEHYDNLKQNEVKDALLGFRQALKDLGAIK